MPTAIKSLSVAMCNFIIRNILKIIKNKCFVKRKRCNEEGDISGFPAP